MGDFITALSSALAGRGMKIEDFCKTSDPVEKRMLQEYGAVFLINQVKITGTTSVSIPIPFTGVSAEIPLPVFGTTQIPSNCILDDAGVTAFQSKVKAKTATVGGTSIKLQEVAMDDLLKAEAEVKKAKLKLTPRGGSTAASRTFGDTKTFWDKKVDAGLAHWKGQTKKGVKFDDASKGLKTLPIQDQIKKVLELESNGFFFSLSFDKTILQSVAAPGASQHLWLLALDIEEFTDARIRTILAKNGWFQTIKSDRPHFTYLGIEESKLSSLGLKKETASSQEFWVPDI